MAEVLSDWLARAGAHNDVVVWARAYGADWARAFGECPRGDWMLAVAARLGAEPRSLVLAAAACARTALDAVPPGDTRVLAAIETAERWARGDATAEECAAVASALEALETNDPGYAAAVASAAATAQAVGDPEAASLAASNAAQAALFGAGDCAMMALYSYAQRACAEAVRRHVDLAALGTTVR